jgi:hypothetical protein
VVTRWAFARTIYVAASVSALTAPHHDLSDEGHFGYLLLSFGVFGSAWFVGDVVGDVVDCVDEIEMRREGGKNRRIYSWES